MIAGIIAARRRAPTPVPESYPSAVLALSPWGYWRLDEAGPMTDGAPFAAIDSSGNGRAGAYGASGGQLNLGFQIDQPGLFDGSEASVRFTQATNARINLPSYPTAAAGASRFSIGAWIKTTGTSLQHIVSADGSHRVWQFRSSAGALQFITIYGGAVTTVAAAALNDDAPHAVWAVVDETLDAAAGRVKLFVDGQMVAASTGNHQIAPGVPAPMAIGNRSSETNYQESRVNQVDEVVLVASALTAEQVAMLWELRGAP